MSILRVLSTLMLMVPTSFVDALVAVFYCLVHPFLGRERAIIVQNAMHVLQLSEQDAKTFSQRVLKSQFIIYLETILFCFHRDALKFDGVIEYNRAVSQILSHDKGVVTFTAHLGAWELAGYFATLAAGRPMYVLAKPSKTMWINPILDKMREKLAMKVLWTHSKSLLRDMLSILDRGEGLGFVMDQKPALKQGGIPVEFMGIANTSIVQGPAQMIAKKNVAAFGSYCVRLGPRHYRVIATIAMTPDHAETNLAKISACLAKDMESVIRQYPEQWAWNYRRWKWGAPET